MVSGWEGTNARCIGAVFVYFEELGGDIVWGWWSERRYRMIGDKIESIRTL